MTSTDFHPDGPPASEETVAALERRLGLALPEDYRRFLRRNNGGRITENIVDIPAGHQAGVGVDEFLGAERNDRLDIAAQVAVYRDRVPAGLLPIAHAAGGNLILLAVGRDDHGSVWFWDHEYEVDEGEIPHWENLTRLASSLDEFMSLLAPYELPDELADSSHVIEAWINPAFLAKHKKYS